MNKNYSTINAKQQLEDKDSIFHYYKQLIALRKQYDVIAYGDFKEIDRENRSVIAYERNYQNETLLVISNFYGKEISWTSPSAVSSYKKLLGNYESMLASEEKIVTLRPYEAMILYKCN